MEKPMNQRSAIVTGSTSGIGLGIAEAFARSGMNVMINGFGEASAIEADRARLEALGGSRVVYSAADMTKPADIREMVAEARAVFGTVDVVVNNAGIQHVSPIEDFPDDRWDSIIAINLSSAFHLTKATIASMKEAGWGRIINIASAHALVASPFKSAYVAAKHGIAGLTKSVALEAAERGVTVNAICPGYVLTPLVQKQIPDTAKARGISEAEVVRDVLLAAQPTKRFVTVEEISALTLFLCSEGAGSMTGAILSMDGGWTAA
jgi:3-hydroxybutyrate dehydrogenase